MTLEELSAEYRKSAALLSGRLRSLREQLKHAETPEEKFGIKRRIAELTPMLTEMNKIAEITAHYYERGFWRDAGFTSNCFTECPGGQKASDSEIFNEIYPERADGCPAGYVRQVPTEGPKRNPNSRGTGRKQKLRKPQFEAGRAESGKDCQLPDLNGSALMKALFGK